MSDVTPSEAPSPPVPIAVAVEDARLIDEIVGRFEPDERRGIVTYDDPHILVEKPDTVHAEVVIVSFPVMKHLAKYHMDVLTDFCHRNNVVLLIRSQEFLDSIPFFEFANGVIFMDATMNRLKDILALSGAGYSILPSAAVMDIVSDRLRCDQIQRLSIIELSILDQVRLAKTNRAIARSLGLTEANVKTKVRAILKALKFQNRTEAAVFAARQNETIRNAIVRRTRDKVVESRDEGLKH
jgi:DNA-binding NarL/FixJ family response regulator